MKLLLIQSWWTISLLIVTFISGHAQTNISDSLKQSSFFIEQYGTLLDEKIDSITSYYETIIDSSINSNDHILRLNALINLAELRSRLRDYNRGERYLLDASNLVQKYNIITPDLKARISKCHARLSYNIYNYPDVIKHSRDYINLCKDHSFFDLNDLLWIYNTMTTSYQHLGEYDSSLIYIEKIDNLLASSQKPHIIFRLNNSYHKAAYLRVLGKHKDVCDELLKAIPIIDTSKPSYLAAKIYTSLGRSYYSLRELDKSIQYYEQAIKVLQYLKLPIHPYQSHIFTSMAHSYSLQGYNEIALELIETSIKSKLDNNDLLVNAEYLFLAAVYIEMDSLEQANKYLQLAVDLISSYPDKISPSKRAGTLFYYGHFLIEQLHDTKGVELTKQSLKIYKSLFGEKHPAIADCYNYLGKAKLLINKKPNEALVYLQKALISNDKTFNNSKINTNPKIENALNKKFLLTILTDKADALKMKVSKSTDQKKMIEDIELMNNNLLLAIQTIDFMRTSFTSVDSKLKMNEKTASLYSKLITSTLQLYNITNNKKHLENAYTYAANSKTAILNGLINDDLNKITAGIPEEVLKREKELRIESGELNNQLYNLELTGDDDKIKKDQIKNKIFNTDQEIDLLTANFEKNYTNYYQLKYQNKSFEINQLQENLNDKQVVVEYFITDTTLVGFTISKKSLKLHTVKIDSNFYQAISELQSIFNSKSYTQFDQELFNSFKKKAFSLYHSIIAPFETDIKDKEIIVIPDKELLQLPFEALLTDSATGITNYRNLPYFIKKHPISYSYSTEWLINGKAKKAARNKLLAIVPSYNTDVDYDNLINTNNISTERDKITPIPAALDEAKSIIESIDGAILKAEEATEAKFKEIANQYSILHFAMHTLIENNNPMFSKLVFTHSNEDSLVGEDNMLNTYEIFNLDLKAQMVVLSSCKSGYGTIQKGEGIMSMARGFIFAGCPCLTLTLWSIDDDASSDLMDFYYQNLAVGMNKTKALQMAKVKFLEIADPIRVHPHFWASHIVVGDTKKLNFKGNSTLTYCASIFILTILILIIFRKRIIRVLREFLQHGIGKNPYVPQ